MPHSKEVKTTGAVNLLGMLSKMAKPPTPSKKGTKTKASKKKKPPG